MAKRNSNEIFVVNKAHKGMADLCFRIPLLNASIIELFNIPLRDSSQRYLANLTEEGKLLVTQISKIAGISQIAVHIYDVTVFYSGAFTWDRDVGPPCKKAIIDALKGAGITLRERRVRKSFKGKQVVEANTATA